MSRSNSRLERLKQQIKTKDGSFAIIVCEGKLLLFHRDNNPDIPFPDKWQLPGGGIEAGETPIEGLKRELLEEISYVPKNLKPFANIHHPHKISHFFYALIPKSQTRYIKKGLEEGQDIDFFTYKEAIRLKLTPGIRAHLLEYTHSRDNLMRLLQGIDDIEFAEFESKVS